MIMGLASLTLCSVLVSNNSQSSLAHLWVTSQVYLHLLLLISGRIAGIDSGQFFRSNQMINKTMISEVTPSQPYDHMKPQLFGEIYSWCKMSFFGKNIGKLKDVGLVENRNMKCIFGGLGRGCGVGWVGGGEWRQKINCTYRHTWCYARDIFSCTCTHTPCYARDIFSCTYTRRKTCRALKKLCPVNPNGMLQWVFKIPGCNSNMKWFRRCGAKRIWFQNMDNRC